MFRIFESRVQPYPEEEPTAPPSTLVAFCWHYSKPVAGWLIFMSVLTAAMAAGEVLLFGFLGSIVDWLSNAERIGFLERESSRLWLMGGFLLVGLPAIALLHSLIVHQTLLGNYPMIARWQMHRYLLKQSIPGAKEITAALDWNRPLCVLLNPIAFSKRTPARLLRFLNMRNQSVWTARQKQETRRFHGIVSLQRVRNLLARLFADRTKAACGTRANA